MSDFPNRIFIKEKGPREGFQSEPVLIAAKDKIRLIDALSNTGLREIEVASFVSPKRVPNMADAEQVVAGLSMTAGVDYTCLYFNEQGFRRAEATGRLKMGGTIMLCASRAFLSRNQNRTPEEQVAEQRANIERHKAHGIPIDTAGISAAFGCNFEGQIDISTLLKLVDQQFELGRENNIILRELTLLDTMAWATPDRVKRLISAIREHYPNIAIGLHLHDTRGMGIANAFAGLEMGVTSFESSVAGLGGCPFANHQGAAGNVCTEDLVFMAEEMGIETGVDLERLIECARLAEEIVGRQLPGSVKTGGALSKMRA